MKIYGIKRLAREEWAVPERKITYTFALLSHTERRVDIPSDTCQAWSVL